MVLQLQTAEDAPLQLVQFIVECGVYMPQLVALELLLQEGFCERKAHCLQTGYRSAKEDNTAMVGGLASISKYLPWLQTLVLDKSSTHLSITAAELTAVAQLRCLQDLKLVCKTMAMNALQQLAPAAPTLRRLQARVDNPEGDYEDFFPPLSNLTHLELDFRNDESWYITDACLGVARRCCNLVELKVAAVCCQEFAITGIIANLTQLSVLDLSKICLEAETQTPALTGLGNLPELSHLHMCNGLLTEELEALS
eukprot:jgi/Chrzof1/1664/Cz10g16120.t1